MRVGVGKRNVKAGGGWGSLSKREPQPECPSVTAMKSIRANGAVLVNNKRDKFTTLIAAVGAILADLSTGSGPQRLAGLHVLVGGGMDVNASKVKQNSAVGHGDMAVR